ncbi:hypothetical protein E0W68_13795 [Flavobacterium salilacus subsp. salilacus]|uniref:hypothetical protein n=1 Tax=Flavobacterium TaxID=237 RepID=UPI0010753B97|nr:MULTISPECIES: hypothetical protein [Flavobacterium]KAF2514153.1 hypothetical protein E0W68_13795 [Flavobacterium salilacus subsp. salilacus]MBE1615187.1 hypothetical protein [Flavobacterium sp. SaA2.13]
MTEVGKQIADQQSDKLIGGDYDGQSFSEIEYKKSFLDYFNMKDGDIRKLKVEHKDFGGTGGVYSQIRDGKSSEAYYAKLVGALLGVSDASTLKGKLKPLLTKSPANFIMGGYLYLIGNQDAANVKAINAIKDRYDSISGNQGVYFIEKTTTQGNRMGGINYSHHLDVYDVSNRQHLGTLKTYY